MHRTTTRRASAPRLTLTLVLIALAAIGTLTSAPAAFASRSAGADTSLAALAVQQASLIPASPAHGDWFGCAVAIEGDTALVGASNENAPPLRAGYVSAFVRANGAWTLQQTLTAPGGGVTGDFFGHAVALQGDTAVIGARGAGGSAGAAYVFTRSNGLWTLRTTWTGSGANDQFGHAVALDGDTAIVSAPFADGLRGTARVYTGSGATWTLQQTLSASGGAGMDLFGDGVALAGDTAVIGAPFAGAFDAGAAYVFTRSAGVWTQGVTPLTASDATLSNDRFGSAVAISGDSVLVGAYDHDFGNPSRGAAYVFTRAGGVWTQQQELSQQPGSDVDEFGWSVAIQGDVALIGADRWGSGADFSAGAAFVYTRSGTAWTMQQQLKPTPWTTAGFFGSSVALSGGSALVGAETSGDFVGAAYVFTGLLYVITPGVSGGHGTISPSTAQTVLPGATPTFSFTPDPGYTVHQVLVDGGAVSLIGPASYTFPAVAADHTIAVSFTPSPVPPVPPSGSPPVTTASGAHRGWSKVPVRLTLTAAPAPGGAAVAYTEHEVNGGGDWKRGGHLTVRRQGRTVVRYRSADVLGDLEKVKMVAVRVDSRRPAVKAKAAAGPSGSFAPLSYRVHDHVPGCGSALVRLVVTDGAGRALTRSSTRWASTNRPHTVRVSTRALAPGTYLVVLRAMDRARNFQRGVTRTTLTVR